MSAPPNKNTYIPPPDASRPFSIYNRVPDLRGQHNNRVTRHANSFFRPDNAGFKPAPAPAGLKLPGAVALQPVLGFGPPPVPGGIGLDLPLGPPAGEEGAFSVRRNTGKRGKLAHRGNTKPNTKPVNTKAPGKTRRSSRRTQRKN